MIEVNNNLSVKDIMQKIKLEINKRRPKVINEEESKIEKFKTKPFYHITDFYQFEGEKFIKYLYIGILKREADPRGLQLHLENMINNASTKEDMFNIIYDSEESQINKVKVLGLNNSSRTKVNNILMSMKSLNSKVLYA